MPYPSDIWRELTQEKRKDIFLEATKEVLAKRELPDDLHWVVESIQMAIDDEIEATLEEMADSWKDDTKADVPRDSMWTGDRTGTLNLKEE